MNPDVFFAWVEQTAFSVYVRESQSVAFGFPGILVLHTIGMGLLAGACAIVDLRILGIAPGVPLSAMEKFSPVMKIGFYVNAVSGVALLIGYPTKALTNPLFYIKLGLIASAVIEMQMVFKQVVRNRALEYGGIPSKGRTLAWVSLLLWAGAITSGRFLAYTYSRLMVDF